MMDGDTAGLSNRLPRQANDGASNSLANSNKSSLVDVADTSSAEWSRQGSLRDRPIIQVQDDEELAGPAVAAARQLYTELQAEYDEMNVLDLDNVADKLTQSERFATTKIENIVENGTKETDFTGVAKEKKGIVVGISPRTGRPYDHIKEMQNNLTGIRNAIKILKRSLRNGNSILRFAMS